VRHAHQDPPPHCRLRHAHQTAFGFTYVEVVVAIFLVALTLVPAINALQSGVHAGAIHAHQATDRYRLTGAMELILARPFAELEAAADAAGGPTVIIDAYSDPDGTESRRLVYLARYDGDNADADNDPFTGADEGLLWARVTIVDSPDAIDSLITR
jgi:type II secretory pathway component PulJ